MTRFLHASLQLEAIGRCSSAHDVIETLEQFPSDIKEAYHQTWSRICNQTPNNILLAKAVLVWVINAARSMTMEGLRRAIATHPDTHKFEAKRLVSTSTLVTLCCGMVTVEEETKLVRLVRECFDWASATFVDPRYRLHRKRHCRRTPP